MQDIFYISRNLRELWATPPKRDVAENIQKGARRFVREEKNLRMKAACTRRKPFPERSRRGRGRHATDHQLIEAGRYNRAQVVSVAIVKLWESP